MSTRKRLIGGLVIESPLSLEVERALYPVIAQGRDAEVLLAEGVSDPALAKRLRRLRHAGQEAQSLLLRSTLALVRARVSEHGYFVDDEELEAAGVEGLANALRRFDLSRGVRFSTYANYWITKLVHQAIQQHVGVSDAEMRLVVRLQRLQRTQPDREVKVADVARELEITLAKARDVMKTAQEIRARRFYAVELDDVAEPVRLADPSDAPSWVTRELRRLGGEDFESFWQYTFTSMSLDEIASARGITRQALSKRFAKIRRAVEGSPVSERLLAWLAQA